MNIAQPVICFKCQGSGTSHPHDKLKPGILLDLCEACRGSGSLDDSPLQPYRAMFLVGHKFIVRITIPWHKGGFVEMDCDWSPHLPPSKGKGMLKPYERREYEACRTMALQQFMGMMGGGDFSVVAAGQRQ